MSTSCRKTRRGLQSKGCCRLHCWLRSRPRTQRMSLPLSTLRSSSPCASWAAPLSGVCAGSATGFPRTAPTCLRAVGVTALPCPDQRPCCSWCTRQVVCLSGKKKIKTLHQLGKCYLLPGVDYLDYSYHGFALPQTSADDCICRLCSREGVKDGGDSSCTGSSSSTSSDGQ